MTLSDIAATHRVQIRRDGCGDAVIRGRNGHLYAEHGRPMICFTDDGRKAPFTPRRKSAAIRKLGAGLGRITQQGDTEFIAELHPEAIPTALSVLRVRRLRCDAGISRPVPFFRGGFTRCIQSPEPSKGVTTHA